MNVTSKILAGALLLSVAAGGAFAQTYTRDTVSQANPFGTLPVDPQTFAVSEGSIAALGVASVADLNARCDVVVRWPSYYGWGTAAFCENVLYAQGLIADPNAPDSTSGWVTNTSGDDSGWVTNSDS